VKLQQSNSRPNKQRSIHSLQLILWIDIAWSIIQLNLLKVKLSTVLIQHILTSLKWPLSRTSEISRLCYCCILNLDVINILINT